MNIDPHARTAMAGPWRSAFYGEPRGDGFAGFQAARGRFLAPSAARAANGSEALGVSDPDSASDFGVEAAAALRGECALRMKRLLGRIGRGEPKVLRKAGDAAELAVIFAASNPSCLKLLTRLRAYDEYTFVHSVNVCALSCLLGTSLGLGREELFPLGLGALLHDMGKTRTPRFILNKPGRLTETEFSLMRLHPQLGHAMLRAVPLMPPGALLVALGHHERLNGGGYPRGLRGDEVGRSAGVVGLCDAYDAMTNDRVYQKARSPEAAMETLFAMSGSGFAPELVEGLAGCLNLSPGES